MTTVVTDIWWPMCIYMLLLIIALVTWNVTVLLVLIGIGAATWAIFEMIMSATSALSQQIDKMPRRWGYPR